MRLSSNTIHEAGVNAMLKQQAILLEIQQQVSTGRRILTPADDPIAAARILDISQSVAINTQFAENRDQASSNLGLVEGVLNGVTKLIQDVQTATVSAGNAAFSNADRLSLATEIQGRFEELLGLSNSTDTNGLYLFSGYQGNTRPFDKDSAGVVAYNGDMGQRESQVSTSRQMAVSDSGSNIFERIKNGNGVFVTVANTTNNGGGVIDSGIVVDPSSLTGDNYQLNFSVAAGVTRFDVVNTTTGITLSTANAYTSDAAINGFGGVQFSIKGDPADGDQFTISPSTNQSIFTTISDLINVLSTPKSSSSGNANLTNGVNTALLNLSHGLNHILTVRASAGTRMQEVDALQNVGSDAAIQLQKDLSNLRDVDMAKAISDLTQQQTFLEAAQRSFISVSSLSLFDFI